jgi:hypothetical protein
MAFPQTGLQTAVNNCITDKAAVSNLGTRSSAEVWDLAFHAGYKRGQAIADATDVTGTTGLTGAQFHTAVGLQETDTAAEAADTANDATRTAANAADEAAETAAQAAIDGFAP